MSVEGRPPVPGDLWELDSSWRPDHSEIRFALVLCESPDESDDLDTVNEWRSHHFEDDVPSSFKPVYRCLINREVVDLHWSWFRKRISLRDELDI
jgi:hypothetical protein